MTRLLSCAAIALLAACHNNHQFDRTDLVSDQSGVGLVTDPGLVNAWGLAVDGGDLVYIAANGTGQISVYNGQSLQVPAGFPVDVAGPAPITGMVVNDTAGFVITGDLGTASAQLLTSSEDGKVYAYNAAATSAPIVILDDSATNASFKGLTMIQTGGVPTLLVADFINSRIRQVGTSLKATTSAPTAFVDPSMPANYGPFGIQAIGSLVYVTFAQHGSDIDEADGPGLGVVDAFAFDGSFVQRISNGLELNAPWGIALAPDNWGDFGDALLVGNFGDGLIHAYDPNSGELLGAVEDRDDNPIVVSGVWGIGFGNERDDATLFFAGGPDGESHGLFGKITPR